MPDRKKTGVDTGKRRAENPYGQPNQPSGAYGRARAQTARPENRENAPTAKKPRNPQNSQNPQASRNKQNSQNTQNSRNTRNNQNARGQQNAGSAQNQRNPQNSRAPQNAQNARNPKNTRAQSQPKRSKEEQSRIVRNQMSAGQPQKRRMERNSRKLNPHQLEIQRRREEARRFYIKKKRISAVRLFFSRFVVFCGMFILLFAVCVGLFFLNLFSNDNADRDTITYRIGEEKGVDTVEHKIPRSSVCFDGVNYVDFSELADLFDFVVTGDVGELKFITTIKSESGDDQYGENVKFYVGTSLAEINGNEVRLTDDVVSIGDTIYVPVDFIDDYVSGLSVIWDSDSRILQISRETGADGAYTDISFTLKEVEPATHIAEADLDESTRYLTDPVRIAEEKRAAEEALSGAASADTVALN